MLYAYNRPQPAGQGYISIFADGAPGDRVEWPVFGEEINDLTAVTGPDAVTDTAQKSALPTSGIDATRVLLCLVWRVNWMSVRSNLVHFLCC